jgi:NADPH:quinone reductase
MSATMRIVDVPEAGGPEALVMAERPRPQPGPGEVLIRVAAAGVNRADVLQRRGRYPSPPGAPQWPGLEVSGTVAELGPGATGFAVGDEVCALLQGGGYAEYAAVAAGQVLHVPAGIGLLEAGSLPEACFTVWSNVFGFGRLGRGERLLVHGGASGIGVTAIQLARALGSTVFATAGTDDKCRFCESLGAAHAVNYRSGDFVAALKERTGGHGVDVILDMVGGDYLARNLELLAPEGRLVLIATQGGVKAQINLLHVMSKRAVVTGSTLRGRELAFKQRIRDELVQHVWPLVERGELRAVVDRTFPLEQAAAAHAYMESGAHRGKIMLAVGT